MRATLDFSILTSIPLAYYITPLTVIILTDVVLPLCLPQLKTGG